MVYKLNEYVYLRKDKYTFKGQAFLNNNNRLVYCLVAINGGVTHCLLQSLECISKERKDKAINAFLKGKKRLTNYEYADAKPLVELTNYKVGK